MLFLEHYVTLFNDNEKDEQKKRKYLNQVWDILQKSYAKIGGIAGMDEPETLMADNLMWKLVTRNNKVVACSIYKYNGSARKIIAGGTDGTPQGKEDFYKMCEEDVKRIERNTWAEVSGSMEGVFIFKLNATPIPAKQAKDILKDMGKDIISISNDEFHYTRKIGNKQYEKIMFGNVPKKYRNLDWNEESKKNKDKFFDYVKQHPEEVETRKKSH